MGWIIALERGSISQEIIISHLLIGCIHTATCTSSCLWAHGRHKSTTLTRLVVKVGLYKRRSQWYCWQSGTGIEFHPSILLIHTSSSAALCSQKTICLGFYLQLNHLDQSPNALRGEVFFFFFYMTAFPKRRLCFCSAVTCSVLLCWITGTKMSPAVLRSIFSLAFRSAR